MDIASLIAEHDQQQLANPARKLACESLGVDWKDYKRTMYATGTVRGDASRDPAKVATAKEQTAAAKAAEALAASAKIDADKVAAITADKTLCTAMGVVATHDDDRDAEPEHGTFQRHIMEVERKFWNERFPVYDQWRKDFCAEYKSRGCFDTHTGFYVEGVFRRAGNEESAPAPAEVVVSPAEGCEPHWPTYREIIDLCAKWRDLDDAKKHRDVKDVQALMGVPNEVRHIAEMSLVPDGHAVVDILNRDFAPSEAQAKLVALTVAKLATHNGLATAAPLSADTASQQHNTAAELDEIVIDLPTDSRQRVAVRVFGSKKVDGKPWLAKLVARDGKIEREFADGAKSSGSTRVFRLSDLRIGEAIQWHAYVWDGRDFIGGRQSAVVVPGGVALVSQRLAESIVLSGGPLLIDRFTAIYRLSPDAALPEECDSKIWTGFEAYLLNENGEIINTEGGAA